MKSKRILLVGSPASIHVYNYVKNVLCYEGYEVTIFNYNGENTGIRDEFLLYYSKNGVKLVEGLKPVEFFLLGYWKYINKTVRLFESLGSYDILHVHYVKHYISPAIYRVKHLYKRIIITYYGSDLYRLDSIRRLFTIPSLSAADQITLINDDMFDYLKSLPFYMRKYLKKCYVVDFGNMFYGRIASFGNEKEICKKTLGFEPNSLVITLGYVGRPQMQQYETLEALITDKRIGSYQVQFAIPAYGISNDDYNRIQALALNNGINFKIFKEFMGEEEVSRLRVGTDIFIHAQTTDALSSAMLEHLFAGSVVINGSWLRYGTLTNNKVYYKTFDNFSSLSEVVVNVIENIDEELIKSLHNREIVSKISSWENLRPLWLNTYK